MGFCSAVTLAFATIFSLVAAALLAIAFSTDNWITITVQRNEIKVGLKTDHSMGCLIQITMMPFVPISVPFPFQFQVL